MSKTGKNEQNTNYYLIAANGFIKEHKIEKERVHEYNDRIVARSRGGSKGIMKLGNIQRHLHHLQNEHEKIKKKTAGEFGAEKLFVTNNLQCADEILKNK